MCSFLISTMWLQTSNSWVLLSMGTENANPAALVSNLCLLGPPWKASHTGKRERHAEIHTESSFSVQSPSHWTCDSLLFKERSVPLRYSESCQSPVELNLANSRMSVNGAGSWIRQTSIRGPSEPRKGWAYHSDMAAQEFLWNKPTCSGHPHTLTQDHFLPAGAINGSGSPGHWGLPSEKGLEARKGVTRASLPTGNWSLYCTVSMVLTLRDLETPVPSQLHREGHYP